FAKLGGKHRTFLEVHLAKSRRSSRQFGPPVPHVVTTGYMTHGPIAGHLERYQRYGYPGPVHLSPGRSVGLRLVPMARDLRFAWEETAQQGLGHQPPEGRDSLR